MEKKVNVRSGKAFTSLLALVRGSNTNPPASLDEVNARLVEIQNKVDGDLTAHINAASSQISEINNNVDVIESSINSANSAINANTTDISQLKIDVANNTSAIQNTNIAITEANNSISNVSDRADTNTASISALSITVNANKTNTDDAIAAVDSKVDSLSASIDEKINEKVSGAFKFKGSEASKEALDEIEVKAAGDVYQVGDKEYAYNGSEWVELGFAIDLSEYAKADDLEGKANSSDVVALNEKVAVIEATLPEKADKTDIPSLEPINNSISAINGTLATKADSTVVEAKLELKADKSDLDNHKADYDSLVATVENKVDKDGDKVLSSNDFTDSYKEKLDSLNDYVKKEDAFSGDYNDLANKPDIPVSVDADLAQLKQDVIDLKADKADGVDLTSTRQEYDERMTSLETNFDNHTHSYNDLEDKPHIPSTENLASKEYVDGKLEEKASLTVLDNYVLKADPDPFPTIYAKKNEIPSLNGYALRSELEEGYATKSHNHSEYVTNDQMQSAINASVSGFTGAFKFKGSAESKEALDEIEVKAAGDVYQVGDKEYVLNNSNQWIELGSPYGIDIDTTIPSEMEADNGKVPSTKAAKDYADAAVEALAMGTVLNHDLAINAEPDGLKYRMTAVENDLSSVENDLSSKASSASVSALDQRVSEVETYGARLDTNESRTSEVSDKVDEIDARLTEVETNKASVSYVDESKADLVATIQSMSATIGTLQDEIRTLSNTVIALKAYVDSLHNEDMSESDRQLVNAAVNGTPYVVPASDNAEDVNIDVPLFNTVNVTSENVNITSDITAVNESAAGIQIKASDKVTVGE